MSRQIMVRFGGRNFLGALDGDIPATGGVIALRIPEYIYHDGRRRCTKKGCEGIFRIALRSPVLYKNGSHKARIIPCYEVESIESSTEGGDVTHLRLLKKKYVKR